jgi:hypothetical protein
MIKDTKYEGQVYLIEKDDNINVNIKDAAKATTIKNASEYTINTRRDTFILIF